MKRKLSLIVLVAMLAVVCFGVLAACKGNGLSEYDITTLVSKVEEQITNAQGKTSYTLSDVVVYEDVDGKEISCNVKWEADSGVTITNGAVTVPQGVTSYILTATLVGDNGKEYKTVTKSVSAISSNQGNNNNNNQGNNDNNNQGNNQGNQQTPTPSGDKGTQGNPYTVAEALAIIDGLEQGGYSSSAVYTTGIVSNYSLGNSGQHKCDISDTGSSSTLTVYYADLGSGVTSFKNGDTIVVYGYLMHFYNSKNSTKTPEVASNNNVTPTVVSVNAGTVTPTPTPTPTPGDGTLAASINLKGDSTVKSSSASENVFESNGITVTNSKAAYDKDLAVQTQYEQRFYAKTTVKIDYTSAVSKIVITLDSQGNSKIEDSTGITLNVDGATVTVVKGANGTVTIEFSQPVTSVTITIVKQIRAAKIDVYC